MTEPNFTRRDRLDLLVPAESSCREAMLAIQKLPNDPLLTQAIKLIEQAQSKVSDYIDSLPGRYKDNGS